jgi:large subunit ribosomal protein L25
MAKQVKLAAQTRSETGRSAVKKIKSAGFVPAVIYSHTEAPLSLKVTERDIDTVLSHALGEHLLVDLEIVGAPNRMALIQEVQHHPVTQRVLHVDFQGVSANEEIESSVPVEAIGEALGVKSYGGILEQLLRSLTIRCLPQDLPELISVDVTHLNVGDTLHVADIKLPAGVTADDEGDVTVFMVAEPTVAAETKPGAGETAAAATPEVLKEKKPAAEDKK